MISSADIKIKNYFPSWKLFTNITIFSLCLCIFISTIHLILNATQFYFVYNLFDKNVLSHEYLTHEYTYKYIWPIHSMLSSFSTPLRALHMIFFILFMTWIYRANHNCRYLGAKDLENTPGWSVGWFFIPLENLWAPYKGLKEIWQASINPQSRKNVKIGPLLLTWWITAITTINSYFILQFLYVWIILRSLTLNDQLTIGTLAISYDIMWICMLILNLIVIKRIYLAQVVNLQKIGSK